MSPHIRELPYYAAESRLKVRDFTVESRPYQIIVWVAVTPVEQDEPPPSDARFPAILDTGHNGRFAISPNQLKEYANLDWFDLPLDGGREQRYQNVPVPSRRAFVWLYANQYGWRDYIDPLRHPLRIELSEGIAVFGDGVVVGVNATRTLVAPRLPILGLRALTEMNARISINMADMRLCLHAPRN